MIAYPRHVYGCCRGPEANAPIPNVSFILLHFPQFEARRSHLANSSAASTDPILRSPAPVCWFLWLNLWSTGVWIGGGRAGSTDRADLRSRVSFCSFLFPRSLLGSLMVQLTGYGKLRPESELPVKRPPAIAAGPPVKLEIEDQLEDEEGPLDKRTKMAPPLQQVDLKICLFFKKKKILFGDKDSPCICFLLEYEAQVLQMKCFSFLWIWFYRVIYGTIG